MITDIKDAENEHEYGELASKLARISRLSSNIGPELRVPDGFVLSASEVHRLLEPIKNKINQILSAGISVDSKHMQLRQLLANHTMPEDMKSDILNKYKTMITDLIDKIPENARHILSGIREKPAVNVRTSTQTYTNIIGDSELLRAITQCCYSAFSLESLKSNSINSTEDINTPVLVQKFINPEKAGQLITDEAILGEFSRTETLLLDEIKTRIQNLFSIPQIIEFGLLRGRVYIFSCFDKPISAENTEHTQEQKPENQKPSQPPAEAEEQEQNMQQLQFSGDIDKNPVSLFSDQNPEPVQEHVENQHQPFFSESINEQNKLDAKSENSREMHQIIKNMLYDLYALADRLGVDIENLLEEIRDEIKK